MSVVSGDVTMGLNATVEKLIRKARASGADTCAVLTELTRSAVGDWPSIQHAGITVVEDGDVVRSIAATDGHVLVVDNIARRLSTGPGIDAALDEDSYRIDDLRADSRWPLFADKVAASTPIRSVIAIPVGNPIRNPIRNPIASAGTVRAALSLYSDLPGAFDDEVEAVAATYAEHIGRVLTARRGRRRAPVSGSARAQGSVRGQDAIETSKAQLMKHFGVDPAAALTVLLRLSRECNRSLEDVARLLVGPRPVAEPPSQATATATPDHAGGRPPVWAEGAA
ncbi:GAF and ANTAR domain-containing protein [Mycolicibacterium thermoresistibile]|nr:GAF and ANTAR domain-containing protein [Mycolicibacterium thermoresistibile]MCV7187956.1 GAF and ANTAR domain-containing protein [Mycolicibacterium thermoresistibile]SNW19291.1 response regulator receiver/ANTAR domain-containing protein [Mycolicibacterium thermoresistibile]